MTLGQQGVPKMIGREGVGGPKLQLGAKFLLGGLERTLVKINETFVIVRLRNSRIELQSSLQFGECAGVVLLLGVGLSEQQVNAGIAGVLFKKTAENLRSHSGLPPDIFPPLLPQNAGNPTVQSPHHTSQH